MKHVEFLNNLSDEQMLQIIDDIRITTEETGEIPKLSLIRDVAKLCSEDFNIPYNLTLGLNVIHKEIMERYRIILTNK